MLNPLVIHVQTLVAILFTDPCFHWHRCNNVNTARNKMYSYFVDIIFVEIILFIHICRLFCTYYILQVTEIVSKDNIKTNKNLILVTLISIQNI